MQKSLRPCVFYLGLLVARWAQAAIAVIGRLIGQTLHTGRNHTVWKRLHQRQTPSVRLCYLNTGRTKSWGRPLVCHIEKDSRSSVIRCVLGLLQNMHVSPCIRSKKTWTLTFSQTWEPEFGSSVLQTKTAFWCYRNYHGRVTQWDTHLLKRALPATASGIRTWSVSYCYSCLWCSQFLQEQCEGKTATKTKLFSAFYPFYQSDIEGRGIVNFLLSGLFSPWDDCICVWCVTHLKNKASMFFFFPVPQLP